MKIKALFTLAMTFAAANGCRVYTPSGHIEGFLRDVDGDPLEVYLGIPFAEAPVGDLRFQKPKPVRPWRHTLDATRLPAACVQYMAYPFPWADSMPGQSEDCLYLNVYVPVDAENRSNLAVLFWIHGGGFTFGSNRLEVYDASALAVHGNVIVVNTNYRLGLFGFLTSGTEDAPGNAGMYDILMALQWVNDNIASFGGDKNRITVFGESAGGMAVSLLCASPLAKGLFNRAILESGTSIVLNSNQLEHNLALAQRLAEAIGCASQVQTIKTDPQSVVGCLRRKNAAQLARVLCSLIPTSTTSFFPQYGDDLIPRNFLDYMHEGNFHHVPLLIGNVRDEGSFLMTTVEPDVFGFFGDKDPIINKTHAENMIRSVFDSFDDPEKYVENYLGGVSDDDYDTIKRQVYTAYGDRVIVCETVYFAESYADRGNDVYYFIFSHRPRNSVWSPWTGVAHAEEIQFIFGRPIRKPLLYESAEVELSQKMIEIWTNFVKTGVPSEYFDWPKYSRKNPTYVNIAIHFKGDSYGTGPHLESCNIMRDHFGF